MMAPRDLMIRYFDGELSNEEVRELQSALLSDPALSREFVASAEIHGRLKSELAAGNVIRMPVASRPNRWLPAALGLAASVALLAGGLWWWLGREYGAQPRMADSVKSIELAVARVIHTEEGQWGLERGRSVELGEWLLPGSYYLRAGTVVVALDVGGTARIEGPAVFAIVNEDRIRLESGSLQARFEEPGQGFTVVTPEGAVVDLGTEFRVDVTARESQVQVVQGRVRAEVGSATRELGITEGVTMKSGALTALAAKSAAPLTDEFANEKPAVFYHWNFDDAAGESFAADGSDGAVQMALRPGLPGRIPQRIAGVVGQALHFSGTGEFLESAYRGVSGSRPRTVAAWVRIPRDAKPEESYGWAGWGLLAGKGPYSESRKWQLSWNPQVKLEGWRQPLSPGAVMGAVRTEFGPGWVNGTRDLRDGEWHHVVSIFIGGEDSDVATHIRHYIDGRLEETSGYQRAKVETSTDEEKSVSLLVGNHLASALRAKRAAAGIVQKGKPYFTGFRGDLDELYIFEGALTPVQVWRLYKKNRPPAPGMISPSIGTVGL